MRMLHNQMHITTVLCLYFMYIRHHDSVAFMHYMHFANFPCMAIEPCECLLSCHRSFLNQAQAWSNTNLVLSLSFLMHMYWFKVWNCSSNWSRCLEQIHIQQSANGFLFVQYINQSPAFDGYIEALCQVHKI